jgi:hypothetical protein
MNLHPDERPQDIEAFRQALIGNWVPPIRPTKKNQNPSIRSIISGTREQVLLGVAGVLILVSLIITLVR